jgi:hypothetical protein
VNVAGGLEQPASWLARALLMGTVPAFAAFGVSFYRKQARGDRGGAISRPKAFWLCFAVWCWFVVCPVVAWDASWMAPPLRWALGAFGVFMWLRGAVEMVMLYRTFNWRPPYGIGHDVACILLLLGVLGAGLDTLRGMEGAGNAWALALCGLVLVSLGVEIHHAWSFFHAVQGRTTGEDGIWFADEEAEHFRAINRTTRAWNWILGLGVGAFVARFVTAGWAP